MGYGGSAEIDGVQVLITSGGFGNAETPSYLEPLSLQPSTSTRSRVLHADGTAAYTGQVDFDVTAESLVLLTTSKLLSRGYTFDVGIDDGEDGQLMEDVLVTSLSLSGAAGGLITASLSFMGPEEASSSVFVANDFIRDQVPYGYWYSGNTDVRDWTFNMNQAVTPVYVNEDVMTPRYLKVGIFDFSLEVTTYEQLRAHSAITIATRTFTLKGNTTSEGFSFTGMTDLGTYAHSFETAADISVGSDDTIIT